MIKSETRGEVTIVTIDRDEKRNALSVEVARGLRHAIESSFAHSRAIVLTGAGKAFFAGADLGENKLGGGFFEAFTELLNAVRAAPVPVIAYVNGPAIGAGAMLAMVCDIRVAGERAFFSIPVADMAIGVEGTIVELLTSLVGGGRARAMLLAGMRLERDESVACGMSLPGGMDEAVEVAQRCAGKAPLSIRNIKAEFAPDLFTSEERDAFRAAPFSSEDFAEGARARREKRPPRFMGW
ncbi:enoyl-CoA hydratase-related protein [Corynebacterium appendicis]|uniref:enoyl-CoA hydratase-related protein n=1 Tax=Corynebacterium appendicis TaxID=163202 RepID=UPI002356DE11|nr:enoyl-CoA hydratase-related protein [Corynebacterium appendicis]